MKTPQKKYIEYQNHFSRLSNDELLDAFNKEVGNNGWTSSRALYLAALHDEFRNRKFDYSAIGNEVSLSLKKKTKFSKENPLKIELIK